MLVIDFLIDCVSDEYARKRQDECADDYPPSRYICEPERRDEATTDEQDRAHEDI